MSAQELSIEGQVTDIQGAKLASAQVIIHWDRGVSIGVPNNIGIKRDLKISNGLEGPLQSGGAVRFLRRVYLRTRILASRN
jgi:hypothetical protein